MHDAEMVDVKQTRGVQRVACSVSRRAVNRDGVQVESAQLGSATVPLSGQRRTTPRISYTPRAARRRSRSAPRRATRTRRDAGPSRTAVVGVDEDH